MLYDLPLAAIECKSSSSPSSMRTVNWHRTELCASSAAFKLEIINQLNKENKKSD